MAFDPLHVPKKFRNDKYLIMSERELTIINELVLKRLQNECAILTGLLDKIKKQCIAFVSKVNDIISISDISE